MFSPIYDLRAAHLTTLYGSDLKEFETPQDIICGLSIPAVDLVFSHSSEPGPVTPILQMPDAKVLFNDIPDFGDFYVTFNFIFSQSSHG